MANWNSSNLKDLIRFSTLLVVIILSNSLGSALNTKSSVLIQFDPYVSILDCENRSRYGISEMVPFITQVSTQFTKVFIMLSETDLLNGSNSSLSLSPQAVAQHNALNKPKISIQVWLGYIGSSKTTKNNTKLSKILSQLESLAHQANNIHDTTITTIFLPQTFFLNANKNIEIPSTFGSTLKIGVLLDPTITSCTSDYKTTLTNIFNFKLKPTMVLFSPNGIPDKLNQNEIQSFFTDFLRDCQNFNLTSSNTGFLLSISDTNELAQVNTLRLVSTHKLIENWSKSQSTPIILSKAFDTPCESTIKRKTNGLWRLIENFKYRNTTEYKFEDKTAIAPTFDRNENFLNKTRLQNNITIYRNCTGIIFSLFDQKRNLLSPYPEPDLEMILEYIENQFSKVIIMIEDNTRQYSQLLLFQLRLMGKFSNKTEIAIMVLPNIERVNDILGEPIENVGMRFEFPHEKFSSVVIPYMGKQTAEFANDIKTTSLKNRDLTIGKFGYLFPMSICSIDSSLLKNYEEGSLVQTVNDVDSKVIYFYFEENEETVKLGANRMFSQRSVLFEQCRDFLRNCGASPEIQLGFILLHYATSFHFYKNSLSIQNFVKYWELLSSWAEGSGNTAVILNNVVDGSRTFKGTGQTLPEVGWWRYSKENSPDILNDKLWLNKQEETLHVAEKEEEEKAKKLNEQIISSARGLSTSEIILIVVVPLGFCVMFIGFSRYLIRRYYRETYLSRREIDDFFLGNDDLVENKPDKMPYDKERYEVNGDKFEIQEGPALGCGEFGRVCRGKVETQMGIITVAVKMVNPEKIRKTTLNGLLSEIKVLAHLGKHENVTELIGANTVDLKHGKVFIFLELCQLGSLEKYLRKLRPELDGGKEEEFYSAYQSSSGSGAYANDNRYVNMVAMMDEEVTLDEELSRDLYRWSKDICNGMAYLASKNVVHADLATRNVLLNLRKEAKLCDFGLSRRLYSYTSYVKKHQEPLPWKWMSPEALRLLEFNEKSDVWAYGVTLWEIYSLGDSPYSGMAYNLNFPVLLEQGLRLNKPKFNDKNMYAVMRNCWYTNPSRRPTFTDLLAGFP